MVGQLYLDADAAEKLNLLLCRSPVIFGSSTEASVSVSIHRAALFKYIFTGGRSREVTLTADFRPHSRGPTGEL